MKYVILIHSNPEPWGHPTQLFTKEGRALPQSAHDAMNREFDRMFTEIQESGEFVSAEALGDPTTSTLFRWSEPGYLPSEGPYAETKEHLAGFFIIDCETRERAELIASGFSQPGGTVELRPAMWGGGHDA